MKETFKSMQRGQILLITLLVLAFAVTVAISLIARSTTDVAISNQTEDSAKAFSAAEAGIEQGMSTATSSAATLSSGDAQYSVTVSQVGGAAGVLTYPRTTTKENTETVWLVGHAADGSLDETRVFTAPYIDVCWTKPGTTIPAIAVSILYKQGSAYEVAKAAYDPDGATRSTADHFSAPTSQTAGSECGTADYRARLTFADFGIDPASDTLLMLRLRPVYGDTTVSVNTTAVLPLQGKQVTSVGTSEGGATRKIVVFQQYRSAESFFDAALYSQASLNK